MCVVKKHNLELKRHLVTNHCIAGMKNIGLVDMCLFSGEGKPTLLGGYGIPAEEAIDIGRTLMNTGMALKPNLSKEDKIKILRNNVLFMYQLLQDVDETKAKGFAKLFDIKKVDLKQKHDTGYIG